jgi:hypothetical protein
MHVVSGWCLSGSCVGQQALLDRRIGAWIVSGWDEYWDVARG